jgi:hypothetical protein
MFTLGGMNGLRVAELAARVGVAASTVRFYERARLVAVWPSGSCQSSQAQMRVHLAS